MNSLASIRLQDHLFVLCLVPVFLLLLLVGPVSTGSALAAGEGKRVLMMAPEYKHDWGLIRDRNSVAQVYDVILEPESFNEALEMIRRFGKQAEGRRIARLTFLGHGDTAGGIMDFGDVDINSGMMQSIQAKAMAEADSSIVDAFEDNAEVIFYQCYAGRDPDFVNAAASLFLAFSGGTVYASPEAVVSPTSTGNKLVRLLNAFGLAQAEDLQHNSPSDVPYTEFNSVSLTPFKYRDMQPVEVSIEGPQFAVASDVVTLKSVIPPTVTSQAELKPYLKYYWFKDENKRKKILGVKETLSPDTSKTGLFHQNFQLRLSNGMAAKVIGASQHALLVEEARTLGIELSTTEPEPGGTTSAKAMITKGVLPQDALWQWGGEGGVRPLATGGETVDVEVIQSGKLQLRLKRMGAFGQIHDLASTSVEIKVAAKAAEPALSISAPNEVLETDIFSASLAVPESVSSKAPDGKLAVVWNPSTVGPENTLNPQLQFIGAPAEAKITASMSTGNFVEKDVVIKPALFEGSGAGSWDATATDGRSVLLQRTPASIEQEIEFNGRALADASVSGKIEAWLGTLSRVYGEIDPPSAERVDQELRDALKDEEGELTPLVIGDFKGYIVTRKPVFSPGAWTGGGFRRCDVTAGGRGLAVKGWAMIEVRYSIFGAGWFDNRFKDFMVSQATAAQGEAVAIINSLRLSSGGGFTKTAYAGPELKVTLPSEKSAEGASHNASLPPSAIPAAPSVPKEDGNSATGESKPVNDGGSEKTAIPSGSGVDAAPEFSRPDQIVAKGLWGGFEPQRPEMTLNGRSFSRYFLQHPGNDGPTEIHYSLKGKEDRFVAWIGIDQSMNPNDPLGSGASVRVTATGDGRMLWESGVVGRSMGPIEVNLDLQGIQELTLTVDDAGDGTAYDWLVWADPHFQ